MKLPQVSPDEAISAFERVGFTIMRGRGRGHTIMGRPGDPVLLSIPNHRQLKRGLLRSLIRQAALSVDRFNELLDR